MIRAAWVAVAAACAAVYALRLDHVAGLVVDDAWYIVLAQSLHSGNGFRLISSAAEPILPAVPPGFPAVLSALWAIEPRFPDNVMLLKSVSIAAMFAVATLVYAYAAVVLRQRALGIAAAVATVLLPSFVFLATSTVMPECLFAAVQLAAVFTLDRAAGGPRPLSWRPIVVAAALTAAAILLRSAGVALAAAAVLFLLYKRAWPRAALLALCVGVCVLPWTLYARANAPNAAQRRAHGGSIAYSYEQLLSMRQAGIADAGQANLTDLAERMWINSVDVFGRSAGAIVFPALYRGANESGVEVVAIGGTGARIGSMGVAAGTIAVSLIVSAIAIAGWIAMLRRHGLQSASILVVVTIGMILLVPAHSSFRYLLPTAPLILLFFFYGIRVIAETVATPAAPLRIAAATVVVLFALEHVQYVLLIRGGQQPVWLADYHDVSEVAHWMNAQLPGDGNVASTNPGLIYLLTGRRTVAIDNAAENWERWRTSGIRYVVATIVVEKPPPLLGYRLLYESARQKLWVLDIADKQASLQKTGSVH